MNYRFVLACVAALGLVGTAGAQPKPKPGSDTPDFVITVPLVLQNMAPEIHSVAVWCEVVNLPGDAGARRVPYQGQLVQGQPAPVIASSQPLIIPVASGFGGFDKAGKPLDKAGKPAPAWSVNRIEALGGGSAKPMEVTTDTLKNWKPADKSMQLPTQFRIVAGPVNPKAAVIVQVNTLGATDPALGTAYACHMAFQAKAVIDGKPTDFSIFGTDPGNYTGLPTKSGGKGPTGDRIDPSRDPDRVLHVYGDIPAKPGPR